MKNDPMVKNILNLAGEISMMGRNVKAKSKKSIPTIKKAAAA